VPVRGQRLRKLQLAHYNEARTISERVGMIRMLAKERLRHLEARCANPFNSNSGALLKEVEDTDRDA
jgi:hypothetical protein